MYLVGMIASTRKKLQRLIFFAGEKIYTEINEDSDPKYISACDKSAIKLLTNTIQTVSIIIFSVLVYWVFPIYSLIVDSKIELPIPVFILFTDMETCHGILVNLTYQTWIAFVSLGGNVGIEVMTCMLKNTMWACVVAIGHSCEAVSEILLHKLDSDSDRAYNRLFRNILIKTQDYDR